MPPVHHKDNKRNGKIRSDTKNRNFKKKSNPDEPGVQKVKSALRQTRRLLAKDNLAADVRIASERRLKSLEADLAKAEIRKKERKIAMRYHKIKFFDKQKVTRKIAQAKRALETPELDKKERKKLQKELLSHRVDLNYILNHPKLDKYIALYPSSESNDDQTDKLREERRLLVRQAMERGEMDAEPENRSPSGNDQAEELDRGASADLGVSDDDDDDGTEGEEEPKPSKVPSKRHHVSANTVSKSEKHKKQKSEEKPKKSKSNSSVLQQQLVSVKDDDFFDV
ncbi:rRNA-processing protein EFG1 OS=Coprinopsis cinerea (strain Okayama-7 / 130 / ATCC MYA-4618 / FGSC 9003) GN=EFG1 PE=3 SV=1 [Rhizoctonia solani AG-1 IB]|uniref:rRNA-processing protein EFG1 n=1 Tax=Thanatephorus cucumeris (strain AG1-IB / isolate 7/3/14) TaxID=1108050 RepID=M5BSL6_THACB|nr:rRNA-processing protein EFG1 [Rhizoctonia solani AG-1 IB]CEL52622.1 rRNA-processing protein EFG1 OS=Coprinopsis cinerea (strain Okayama-7 / 130 / ATCC MYA-4618 / FGSC 9003) GN=EFG1 PE=3 SV=1 [Rhizoctonia solani AG-1 IB]